MTCAEVAAVGLPAVYVPLPIGNGEQRLNALPVVDAGGGLLVVDDATSTRDLGSPTSGPLVTDPERLRAMGDRRSRARHPRRRRAAGRHGDRRRRRQPGGRAR